MKCEWCSKEIIGAFCDVVCKVLFLEKRVELLEKKLAGHAVLHLREKGIDDVC